MVRITVDSEQVQFNSQLMVDKKMWKDGGVVGRSATAVHLRTQIEKIKTDITRIYEKEIENKRYPSPLKLKNIYLGIETKTNTVLSIFKKMNEEKRKEVGTSLSSNTYKKYDLTYRRLEEFISFRFKKERYKDIPLNEVDEEFITGFRNFLRVDKKVGHNATSKMMQLFKKAITRARNAGMIQSNPFTQPITFVQVDKGFLTMDELQTIMNKDIDIDRLQRVRDVFVFSCFTGLAYIDVYMLKDENIQKYLDGNYWIISKRHKTGVPINVRLLDIPLRILQKYKGKQPEHRALPMPSNQKMNAYLKELADICGIKKNLTKGILGEYENIKDHALVSPFQGIPRGIGISSYLSELYMRDIDTNIACRKEVMYYARYVDDIFIILTSLPVGTSIDQYYADMTRFFQTYGLSLKQPGDESGKCRIIDFTKDNCVEAPMNYLGYCLYMNRNTKKLSVVYGLSDTKKARYRKKIDNAINHFETLCKCNIKQAYCDLFDSLNMITGNFKLFKSKSSVKVGLFYNNDLLDRKEDLDELTIYLKEHPIEPYAGLKDCTNVKAKLVKRISSIDFKQRWQERKMFSFSLQRIQEIEEWL